MIRKLTLLTLLVCAAATVMADVPDLNLSSASIDPAAEGALVWNLPSGDGAQFDEAVLPGGTPVIATITLTLVNSSSEPIFDYPAEDMWILTVDPVADVGTLVACTDGTIADSNTDVNGQALWLQALKAGGYTIGQVVQILIAGAPLPGGINLVFNSADINGDLVVNLSDIVAFTQLLGGDFTSHPLFAGDFNYDGTINLSDIVRMTQGIGTNCN